MFEFIIGFISGAAIVTAIWLILNQPVIRVTETDPETGTKKVTRTTPRRPDNELARKYADPRYRAQKADELTRKSPGGTR